MQGRSLGPARVWLAKQDIPGLAMARSFGDDLATTVGVFSIPEVLTFDRTKDDQYMILASDGVWEFIENQEMCDLVADMGPNPKQICHSICAESDARWKKE